jgi:riboflavin synthase
MFTGIVRAVGVVRAVRAGGASRSLAVDAGGLARGLGAGDSVAVSGCCLTVASRRGRLLSFDLGPETLSCTTLGLLEKGARVNLEPALRLGGALDGHLVQGHVDGVGRVKKARKSRDSLFMTIACPAALEKFLTAKGSVVVDGVSLTVNVVSRNAFEVCLIPYTLRHTTLGRLAVGDRVNLESDVIGRYVARLMGK